MAPQNGDPDHQAHSPLIGGSAISTFIRGGSLNSYGMGTLGFFASKNNVPKYNNVVLVSNFHVLGDHGGVKGKKVYQPSWTQINGGWKENEYSNPVGVIDDLPPEQNHPYQYPGDPTAIPRAIILGRLRYRAARHLRFPYMPHELWGEIFRHASRTGP